MKEAYRFLKQTLSLYQTGSVQMLTGNMRERGGFNMQQVSLVNQTGDVLHLNLEAATMTTLTSENLIISMKTASIMTTERKQLC